MKEAADPLFAIRYSLFAKLVSLHVAHRNECALKIRAIKPNERLVPVS